MHLVACHFIRAPILPTTPYAHAGQPCSPPPPHASCATPAALRPELPALLLPAGHQGTRQWKNGVAAASESAAVHAVQTQRPQHEPSASPGDAGAVCACFLKSPCPAGALMAHQLTRQFKQHTRTKGPPWLASTATNVRLRSSLTKTYCWFLWCVCCVCVCQNNRRASMKLA